MENRLSSRSFLRTDFRANGFPYAIPNGQIRKEDNLQKGDNDPRVWDQ